MAAGVFSFVWLVQPGTLPEQLLRASVVVAGTVFALMSRYTRSTTTHRVILAVSVTGIAMINLIYALGSSWQELLWWVERDAARQSVLVRQILFAFSSRGGEVDSQMVTVLDQSIRFVTDFYPALLALQLMAGLALAAAISHGTAAEAAGVPPRTFAQLRFNDNLGWVTIGLLAVMLLPFTAPARQGVANLLLVLGVLYALRGIAVGIAGMRRAGIDSGAVLVLCIVLGLLILPISLAGAILLGIVDTRIDLRERWAPPQARE